MLKKLVRGLVAGLALLAGRTEAGGPIPLEPGNGGRSVDARALKPGDLIVSTTTDANSVAIRRATRSPVSHAALYVGTIGGVPHVVEATLAGVRLVPLSEALRDDSLAVALRHPRLDGAKAARLVALARQEVGKPYDGVGVAKQLLCRSLNRQCEVPLSTGSWYCSALLLYAFREAGAPLVTRPPTRRAPGDIASLSVTGDLLYVGHLVAP
jgi:cell wall-associated NlpC family hydrolase